MIGTKLLDQQLVILGAQVYKVRVSRLQQRIATQVAGEAGPVCRLGQLSIWDDALNGLGDVAAKPGQSADHAKLPRPRKNLLLKLKLRLAPRGIQGASPFLLAVKADGGEGRGDVCEERQERVKE